MLCPWPPSAPVKWPHPVSSDCISAVSSQPLPLWDHSVWTWTLPALTIFAIWVKHFVCLPRDRCSSGSSVMNILSAQKNIQVNVINQVYLSHCSLQFLVRIAESRIYFQTYRPKSAGSPTSTHFTLKLKKLLLKKSGLLSPSPELSIEGSNIPYILLWWYALLAWGSTLRDWGWRGNSWFWPL